MSKPMMDFLSKVATDPGYLEKVKANPIKYMEEAGLSSDEQAAVTSGDEARIRGMLTDEELGAWSPTVHVNLSHVTVAVTA